MKYPKMILFDYGHTLLYEPDWDAVRGNTELLKYVTKNPNHCTLEDVRKGIESCLILLYKKPEFLPMRYGIAAIIHKQILKELRKSAFTPSGTIMTQTRTTKTEAKNIHRIVNICIFTNGVK